MLRLAPPLSDAGIASTVVVPTEPGNAADRLRIPEIKLIQQPLHRLRATKSLKTHARLIATFPSEVRALRRIIRRHKIDVVVAGGLANPHAIVAGDLERIATIWQVIDTRTPRAYCRAIRPAVERFTDLAMFGAEALIEMNFGTRGLKSPQAVLRPAVDIDVFRPSRDRRLRTRRELGIPPDAPVVGTVANVNAQKGIEWFIDAAARVHTRRDDVRFVIVGAVAAGDPYAERMRGLVSKSGIPASHFKFAGGRDDVECFYPAFDVKLITSVPRSEGTTTTAMEALACEVPVVSTDVGAVREVIEPGLTGIIVPPLDGQALAEATLSILGDSDRSAGMGQLGRRQMDSRFSLQVAARTQAAMFEQALAHRRRRQR